MDNPFTSLLRAALGRQEAPPVPPAPPMWTAPPKPFSGPVPRVPVTDTRDVPPNQRVAGKYAVEPLTEVLRAAGAHQMPMDLALAMAIREQSTDLANPSLAGGDSFRNPLSLAYPEPWMKQEPSLIEPAVMHAVERASAVAPQGRERQIQAFQGLGAQPTGYNERFKGQPNPYARAVEEIRERVVNVSPALKALMANVQAKLADPSTYSPEKLAAIGDTITRQVRHPNLFR